MEENEAPDSQDLEKQEADRVVEYGSHNLNLQEVLEGAGTGATVDVQIPQHEVVSANRHIKKRFLWGTDVYTPDSDAMAAAQHSGWYLPGVHPTAGFQSVVVTLRVVPAPARYSSHNRNGIRSHSWGTSADSSRVAFEVTGARIISHNEPSSNDTPGSSVPHNEVQQQEERKEGEVYAMHSIATQDAEKDQKSVTKRLKRTFGVNATSPPTLVPTSLERLSAANVGERRSRVVQEVTVQYNLCNEPWLKYHLAQVADRGLKVTQWTSSKLRRETLYLESHSTRYELSWDGNGKHSDSYRFAKCNEPLELEQMQSIGIPHPADHVQVICENTPWEEFRWSVHGVFVKDTEYEIVRVQWLPRTDTAQVERQSSIDVQIGENQS